MFKGRDDWFELWFSDKEGIISTMVRNMVSDLEAGYDYFGKSIQLQKAEIELYKAEFGKQVDRFATMEEKDVNRWCYYDMKKRGVIS